MNDNGYLLIIDFGIAIKLGPGLQKASTVAGTLEYMSPEMLNN